MLANVLLSQNANLAKYTFKILSCNCLPLTLPLSSLLLFSCIGDALLERIQKNSISKAVFLAQKALLAHKSKDSIATKKLLEVRTLPLYTYSSLVINVTSIKTFLTVLHTKQKTIYSVISRVRRTARLSYKLWFYV